MAPKILKTQSEQNRNQFLPLAPEKESLSVPLYTASSSFKNSWLYQAGRHSAEYCSWSLHYLRMTEESKVKRYCKMRQYVLINLKGPHQQTSGQPWCRTRTPLWQPGTLSTCLEQIPPFNTPGLQRGWAEVLVDSRVSGNSTHLPGPSLHPGPCQDPPPHQGSPAEWDQLDKISRTQLPQAVVHSATAFSTTSATGETLVDPPTLDSIADGALC